MNDQGITPRYAGVQADEVAARGGQAGAPAVVIDGTTAGAEEFRCGFQDAGGLVQPVFRITAKGDVIATGQFQGAVAAGGSLQVQSGTATDGVILPLPPGVTEDMVKPGKAALHVQLTPRPGGAPNNTNVWASSTLECFLDAERRLHSLFRWFDVGGGGATQSDLPGLCDYLILVAVPVSTGGQP